MAENYTTYQPLRPLKGVSRDIQYWNEDARRNRQEQRYEEQLAQQQKNRERKEKQNAYDKYFKPLSNYNSKSKSLNELQAKYLNDAQEQMVPLIETLMDTEPGSEDNVKARLKLQSLQQSANKLKTVTDFYTNSWNEYQNLLEQGKIWKDEEWEGNFQNGFNGIELGIDDNGNPVVAFIDTNKDGINDLEQKNVKGIIPFEYIQNGYAIPKWQTKIGFNEVADAIAKRTGEVETVTEKGYSKQLYKNPNQDQINLLSGRALFDVDGNVSELGSSLLRELGLNYKNPSNQDIKTLEETLNKTVTGMFDTKDEQTMDYGARNSAWRIANNQKKDEQTKVTIENRAIPSELTWGTYYADIDTDTTYAMPVGTSVKFKALKDNSNNIISNAYVENYTYDKNGQLLLDVSYTKLKSGKTDSDGDYENDATTPERNERQVIKASNEDEAEFSRQLGLTVSELKSRVKKEKENSTKETQPPTTKTSDKSSIL